MATSAAGQAKLDAMVASGMGKQQAMTILINAQKKEAAATTTTTPTTVSVPLGGGKSVSVPTSTNSSVAATTTPAQDLTNLQKAREALRVDNAASYATTTTPVTPAPVTPVPATPAPATPAPAASTPIVAPTVAMKVATSDLIIIENTPTSIDEMTSLLFDDISGRELINLTRNTMVKGQDVLYTPIANIKDIAVEYNPKSLLSLQGLSTSYFNGLNIQLQNYIPEIGSGVKGSNSYINNSTGEIVIEFENLLSEFEVEIEILNSSSILDDTIY